MKTSENQKNYKGFSGYIEMEHWREMGSKESKIDFKYLLILKFVLRRQIKTGKHGLLKVY